MLTIENCQLEGHFSIAAFRNIGLVNMSGNKLTSFEIGINQGLQLLYLDNNMLDQFAIEELILQLYSYRKLYNSGVMYVFLNDNNADGLWTEKTQEIIDGTGVYTGEGLIDYNIIVTL